MARHGLVLRRELLRCRQLVALTIITFSLTALLVTPVVLAQEFQVPESKPTAVERKVGERSLNTLGQPTELDIVVLASTEVGGLLGQYAQIPRPTRSGSARP